MMIQLKKYLNTDIRKLLKSGKQLLSKKHVERVLCFSLILILCGLCLNLSGKNLLLRQQVKAQNVLSDRYTELLKQSKRNSKSTGGMKTTPTIIKNYDN